MSTFAEESVQNPSKRVPLNTYGAWYDSNTNLFYEVAGGRYNTENSSHGDVGVELLRTKFKETDVTWNEVWGMLSQYGFIRLVFKDGDDLCLKIDDANATSPIALKTLFTKHGKTLVKYLIQFNLKPTSFELEYDRVWFHSQNIKTLIPFLNEKLDVPEEVVLGFSRWIRTSVNESLTESTNKPYLSNVTTDSMLNDENYGYWYDSRKNVFYKVPYGNDHGDILTTLKNGLKIGLKKDTYTDAFEYGLVRIIVGTRSFTSLVFNGNQSALKILWENKRDDIRKLFSKYVENFDTLYVDNDESWKGKVSRIYRKGMPAGRWISKAMTFMEEVIAMNQVIKEGKSFDGNYSDVITLKPVSKLDSNAYGYWFDSVSKKAFYVPHQQHENVKPLIQKKHPKSYLIKLYCDSGGISAEGKLKDVQTFFKWFEPQFSSFMDSVDSSSPTVWIYITDSDKSKNDWSSAGIQYKQAFPRFMDFFQLLEIPPISTMTRWKPV